jgi:hypothetical protein
MRIIGYVEHPIIKITVFKMDDKRSIKFETALFEQTYKFRAFEGFSTFEEIAKLIDSQFINAVETQFLQMNNIKSDIIKKALPIEEQAEFDEII